MRFQEEIELNFHYSIQPYVHFDDWVLQLLSSWRMMVCSGFAIECHNLVIIEAHVQIYLHAEYGHIILPVLFSSGRPDVEEGPRDRTS